MNYWYYRGRNREAGFNLIEMLVVTIIIGIVAAIAVPNFLGLLRRNRVNTALQTLHGAIKETQRQAIRQGRSCRIDFDLSNNKLTANPPNCLLSDRDIDDNIVIRTNFPGASPNISFSHKGSTTRSGTIVVSSPLTNSQKCFVISLGLGIMRTGDYTGSPTGSVSASDCDSN